MTWKGKCICHKAQKPVATGRYVNGYKRYQPYEIFIRWPRLGCPCWGYRSKTKARDLKYEAKLRARNRELTTSPIMSRW